MLTGPSWSGPERPPRRGRKAPGQTASGLRELQSTSSFAPATAVYASLNVTSGESEVIVLRFALVFAILALIAGVLGFGNLAGDFGYIARILLLVFLVLFVVSLILGRGRAPIV